MYNIPLVPYCPKMALSLVIRNMQLIKSNLLYEDCSPYLRVFVSQRDVTFQNTATTNVQRRVNIIKLLRIQKLVNLPNFAPGPNIFLISHRLPPAMCVTGQWLYGHTKLQILMKT